ncbi:ribonuclease H-like domain-containing protein [Tanacetum coccineum]
MLIVSSKSSILATPIGDNVTSEGNVHNSQNGEGPTNVLEISPVLRRSSRQINLPSKLNDFVVGSSVRYGPEKYVCYSKLSALHRNNIYVLANLPPGRKAIGCKWISKIKYKSSGEVDRYKDRLMAKGYSQREGIDYEETFQICC